MRPRLLAIAVAAWALAVPGAAHANTYRVELVNAATNLRADVIGASVNDGQNAVLWQNNLSASQEFDLSNMRGGFFQIRARHSGKCLMIDRNVSSSSNGTRIAQYGCTRATDKSAQGPFADRNGKSEANAICIGTGRHIIKNPYKPRCIDTANPSGRRPGHPAVLQLWTCITSPSALNADNQLWKVYYLVNRRAVTRFQ